MKNYIPGDQSSMLRCHHLRVKQTGGFWASDREELWEGQRRKYEINKGFLLTDKSLSGNKTYLHQRLSSRHFYNKVVSVNYLF